MNALSTTWLSYTAGLSEVPADELLDRSFLNPEYADGEFRYPMANGQLKIFASAKEWYEYVRGLRIYPTQVTLPYVDAFDEALRALFMAYLFPEFTKMAEMKALATLEGALKEAYRHKMCERVRKPKVPGSPPVVEHQQRCAELAVCLEWAVNNDGLEARLVDRTIGWRRPEALNVIRDKQMHGRFEEMLPWGGLFEVIKETIEYAFRYWSTYDIHELRANRVSLRMNAGNPAGEIPLQWYEKS